MSARADVGDGVGDERPGEHRLDLAVLGVVEHDPAALDRAGGVGEVVGEHLVLVELGDRDPPAVARRFGEVTGRGRRRRRRRRRPRPRRRRAASSTARQPTGRCQPGECSGVAGAVVGGVGRGWWTRWPSGAVVAGADVVDGGARPSWCACCRCRVLVARRARHLRSCPRSRSRSLATRRARPAASSAHWRVELRRRSPGEMVAALGCEVHAVAGAARGRSRRRRPVSERRVLPVGGREQRVRVDVDDLGMTGGDVLDHLVDLDAAARDRSSFMIGAPTQ